MKKTFKGKFCNIYYNECEAASPLGIKIGDKSETLCDIVKDLLEIYPDMLDRKDHKLMNKKVKITIEIEE